MEKLEGDDDVACSPLERCLLSKRSEVQSG